MLIKRKTIHGLVAATLVAVGGLTAVPAQAQQPDLDVMLSFIELMQGYYKIIDATHAVSADGEKSAILNMLKIKETYEEAGRRGKAEEALRDVLESTRNPTVRSAAYTMLGELLKESGDREGAAKMFRKGLDESLARIR